MNSLTDCFTLPGGVKIPCIGFGTWQVADGDTAYEAVREALRTGYRHIDTAAAYGNEQSVGRAVKESGIPREEIFITSKLRNPDHGYEQTKAAFMRTLENLGTDYLDLYLIHWPIPAAIRDSYREQNAGSWRAFEEFYRAGKIRAIGVSNFLSHHLAELLETAEIAPMVDQIEYHLGYTQQETVDFCKEKGIQVEAWSPLGSGRIFKEPAVVAFAEKYGRTVAQLCLRWILQKGILPLPKSVTPARIAENARIFDFEIAAEDMAALDRLEMLGRLGSHPDHTTF